MFILTASFQSSATAFFDKNQKEGGAPCFCLRVCMCACADQTLGDRVSCLIAAVSVKVGEMD